MIPDVDIYRAAKLLVDQHGEDAGTRAAERADQLLRGRRHRGRRDVAGDGGDRGAAAGSVETASPSTKGSAEAAAGECPGAEGDGLTLLAGRSWSPPEPDILLHAILPAIPWKGRASWSLPDTRGSTPRLKVRAAMAQCDARLQLTLAANSSTSRLAIKG